MTHEGLLKRVICGHYGSIPKISRLERYLPQGVIAAMMCCYYALPLRNSPLSTGYPL